jgi:hypothetical protein
VIRRLRRVLVCVLAVVSTALAVVLIFVALSPERIAATATAALLGILGLLVLPALTIAAWAWDRAVSVRTGHPPPDTAEPDTAETEPTPKPTPPRTVGHPPGRAPGRALGRAGHTHAHPAPATRPDRPA